MLEHTYQCVSRLQEYWSLSRTRSTAAGDSHMHNAPIRLLHASGTRTPSCVNLRSSDILLHQQVGQWVGFATFFQHCSAHAAWPSSLSHRSTIPQRASCGEQLNCKLAGPRSTPLLLDSPQPQSVTLTRVLHGPSSWCCMLPETKAPGLDSHLPEAPSQLPSFTLSGILPATQEGPQNVSPRDSQQCPQLITAPPPCSISPEETLIIIYQRKGVRYSGKGPGVARN